MGTCLFLCKCFFYNQQHDGAHQQAEASNHPGRVTGRELDVRNVISGSGN
jgi:hypothetical protein